MFWEHPEKHVDAGANQNASFHPKWSPNHFGIESTAKIAFPEFSSDPYFVEEEVSRIDKRIKIT